MQNGTTLVTKEDRITKFWKGLFPKVSEKVIRAAINFYHHSKPIERDRYGNEKYHPITKEKMAFYIKGHKA